MSRRNAALTGKLCSLSDGALFSIGIRIARQSFSPNSLDLSFSAHVASQNLTAIARNDLDSDWGSNAALHTFFRRCALKQDYLSTDR